jgi:hypothetical protein
LFFCCLPPPPATTAGRVVDATVESAERGS